MKNEASILETINLAKSIGNAVNSRSIKDIQGIFGCDYSCAHGLVSFLMSQGLASKSGTRKAAVVRRGKSEYLYTINENAFDAIKGKFSL